MCNRRPASNASVALQAKRPGAAFVEVVLPYPTQEEVNPREPGGS